MNTRMSTMETRLSRVGPDDMSGAGPKAGPRSKPRTMPGEVCLSIERLRIDDMGLSVRQGEQLQGAFERELARLLQTQPMQFRSTAGPTLRALPLIADHGADPHTLGIRAARTLFAAIRDGNMGDGP